MSRADSSLKARAGRNCRGGVTAEFAVTLPVVVFLLALVMGAVAAGTQQLRIEEAARAASRSMARGDSLARAQDSVARLAGGTASVQLTPDGEGFVRAVVSAPAPGVLGSWTSWTLRAESVAALETTFDGGGVSP